MKPFILFFLILFIFSCDEKSENIVTNTVPSGPRTTAVDIFIVKYNTLAERIEATGNLLPNESLDIRPEVSGRLVSLNLPEATYVRKGTLLAKIDDSELLAQQNRLNVQLNLAKKEFERGEELIKVNGISQEEFDRLSNRINEIEADLQIVEVDLVKTKIYAPFSGILGLRNISPGAYVTPSDQLIDLQQINPIKLEFDVSEKFLKQVKEGQSLDYLLEGLSDTLHATVYAISTNISPETRTFKVRARANNPNSQLKPGQFARVNLVTRINEKAVLVPTDAIVPVLQGKQVYLAKSGRAIATIVETGERQASRVQIISGLEEGDSVIVSGLLGLNDGQLIDVKDIISNEIPLQ